MTLFVVGMRLVPYVLGRLGVDVSASGHIYPWNFSPVTALCLFGGAHLAQRRSAYLIPLAALLLSDIGIGLLRGEVGFTVYPAMPFVYAAFALNITLGLWLQKHRSALPIAATAVLGEVLFFLITNGAHWALSDMYPHTASGLIACYVAGLPFFRTSLLGTGLYTTVLFGGFALAERGVPALQAAPLPVSE
jgi:hypothetical protein